MAITMPPTTTPRKTISNGSISEVNPESVVSISSSESIDSIELLNNFCNNAKYKQTPEEIFFCLHNISVNLLNLNFIQLILIFRNY